MNFDNEEMETKEYDAVTRQNLEIGYESVLQKILGFQFKVIGHPSEKLCSTINREVDFVRLVEVSPEDRFILHAEFQTRNHPDMAYRMQEYYAMLARKFKLSVWQFVFYYGKDPLRMDHQLQDRKNHFEFQLINLANFDSQTFFDSDSPEVVIWSILGNPGKLSPVHLLQAIKKRVLTLCNDDFYMAIKCLRELKTFSKLRNLKLNNTKEIEAMKLMIDYTEDELYQEGKAKGIQEGKAQGIQEGKRELLIKLIQNGVLNIEQIKEKLSVDQETIEEWTAEQHN